MTTPLGTVELHELVLPALANIVRGWVSRLGRSSMTVCVTALGEASGVAPEEVLKGIFEMVVVDAAGRPVAIHPPYPNQETTT